MTNDDGVHAPGLAAITRALAAWSLLGADQEERYVTVAAPLINHSGASAAVGTVFERESVAYRMVAVPGAETVPAFGVDAPPALAVILGVLGAFGPPPDLIVSGINLGVNIGRSILHSGTVGATLTGSQMGTSGLAVSLRSDGEQHHWETAAAVAVSLLSALADAPARTVLNLNVPSVPLSELRGIRRGRMSDAVVVKGVGRVRENDNGSTPSPTSEREGNIILYRGTAVPSLGDVSDEDPDEDGALVAAGYASLTSLTTITEDRAVETDRLVARALVDVEHRLHAR